ncbi:MAG: trypsin-like peptidase domain-containing protein [Jatrophihabitantaceae bacterium]
MTEEPGRHTAADDRPAGPAEDEAFGRPESVDGPFAPRDSRPSYTPPPLTASPEEREAFGRPAPGASFAPLAGERIAPRSTPPEPVPQILTDSFGAPDGTQGGFDPAPGSRIAPSGREAESPWWKPDAPHDPWRDPRAQYWLGSGAVFAHGAPEQLEPALDHEVEEDDPVVPDEPDQELGGATVTRGRFGLGALGIVLLVALLAGGLGGGAGYWLANRADNLLHHNNVSLSKVDAPANRPPGSVADIAKRVGPAVVSIAVTTSTDYAVGSGVVIDKNGYVLTNNHVIADAAQGTNASIVVTFSDEATAKAEIVGRDPISDLAVIKVPTDQLTVATLGDSDLLAVGDPVVAIGSPLGLQGTVTSGIVSALGRAVHVSNEDGSSDAYLDAVQTDAAINPGNSGGALVDAAGAVVGINSAGRFSITDASGQQTPISGIGYAIPINYARTIAEELIKTGRATHGSIDAQGRSTVAGNQDGAYLEQVAPGGAAAKAGLVNGDVIVVADGHAILAYDDLVVIVQQHKPGDQIAVTYFHQASKKTVTITLGSA